jgi:hypothetical protein
MKRIAVLLCALALFGLGLAAGHRLASGPPPPTDEMDSSSDPESTLRTILAVPDDAERAALLVAYFDRRDPGDLEAMLAALRKARYDADPTAYLLLADWWTGFDPQAAFRNAIEWPLYDRQQGSAAVVQAWARRDVTAARAAVERITDDERLERCVQALIAGWQDAGAEGLMAYMQELPAGVLQQRALEVFMARKVTRDGIDETLGFAEMQPDTSDPRFKLQVFRRTVTAVASYDPRRAAQWAELHADGPYGDGLLRRAGSAWAFQDPEAAIEWATALPALTGRDEAVRETYRIWLGKDREGALAWIQAQPPDSRLQPTLPLVAVALTRDDPAAGLEWLARIEDEPARNQTTVALVRKWMISDRDAALAWLADSSLPEETKRSIENTRARPPHKARPRRDAAIGARPESGGPAPGSG